MKITIISIILSLSFIQLYSQNDSAVYISGEYRNKALKEFAQELKSTSNTTVYFKNHWGNRASISGSFEKMPLVDIPIVMGDTSLGFVLLSSNTYAVVNKATYISELPDYTNSKSEKLTAQENEDLLMQSQYLKGRQPKVLAVIPIGEPNLSIPNKFMQVSASIEDEESGEPIIGATMYLEELEMGAASDGDGWLSTYLKPGKYTAEFKYLGMANKKITLQVFSSGHFTIKMKKSATSLKEVVINADGENTRGSRLGMEKLQVKKIKNLPTLMGEKDVLKVSQLLPGVVSVSEGSSGVNVRGGNADQNLFYLNGIPIYNSSHLFGFFSAINSNIIKDFSIYKGYVPTEFGGRLSSVFNVETRKGNKKKLFAQGGASLISANLEVEAPIVKDKLSFMVSGRSSYSNWLLGRVKDPQIRNSDALFYDFSGGIDYKINNKQQLEIFANHSSDFFSLNQLTDYEYHNTGMVTRYLVRITPKLKTEFNLIASQYTFATIDKTNESNAYQHDYKIGHYEFNAKGTYSINRLHQIYFGLSTINYDLNRGLVAPYGSESNRSYVDLGNEKGQESAVYANYKYTPNNWLTLNAGLRVSNFLELGPKNTFQYQENAPMDNSYIRDTIQHGSGIISSYTRPEIRLGADFKINSFNSIKLSYTEMTQYLFMLSSTISIAPNDQWKLVDSHIIPPQSKQVSLGYFKKFPYAGLSMSMEGYYKPSKNIVEYKDGADFLSTPQVEQSVLQGNQEAYGAEFMFAKETGDLNGWITYTYSRSIVQVDGPNDWDKINYGNPYASNYDKPHVVNLVANYHFTRRFTFATNLTYNTGRPITYPQGFYYLNGVPFIDYSERNRYRIPDYFRMDASLTLEGNLKKNKPFHSYWVFSVYNLTGRKNANSIFFQSEQGEIKAYKYTLIGVPIATITWNIKLGNYTND